MDDKPKDGGRPDLWAREAEEILVLAEWMGAQLCALLPRIQDALDRAGIEYRAEQVPAELDAMKGVWGWLQIAAGRQRDYLAPPPVGCHREGRF